MRSLFAVRALAAAGAGIFVVFNQGHYVAVSLLALAIFGLAGSIAPLGIAFAARGQLSAIESVPGSILSLTLGAVALTAWLQTASGANPELVIQQFELLATGWALTSGAFELYLARRAGFKTAEGRDFGILAGLNLTLGLLYLVIPTDRTTTVGLFVAFLMFTAVHLGIAAASPRPAQPANPK